MTPKEKAKQLLHSFYISLPNNGSLTHGPNSCDDRWREGKMCALKTVYEITEVLRELGYDDEDARMIYYSEVKQEIEKL